MTSPDPAQFVKEAVRAVNARDNPVIKERFAPDVTYVIRGEQYDRSALITSEGEEPPVDLVDVTFKKVAARGDHATVFADFEYDLVVDLYGINPDSTYVTPAAMYLEFSDGSIDYMRTLTNTEDVLATCGFLSDEMAGGGIGPDLIPDRIRVEFREVIMRFLRHNIRNEVEVIRAVSEDLDPNNEQLADLLDSAATDLATTATKAWESEQDLLDRNLVRTTVELADLVEAVLDETIGDSIRATINTVDDPEPIKTDERLVETAVTELLENVHQHTAEPEVDVTVQPATESDYKAELTIADDGPGIPPSELAPIREGEETTLQHTTSIGLWRVKWYIDRVQGDVEFSVAENGGTRARIRLPALEGDGSTT